MWIKLWATCLLVTLVNAEYLYDANPYSHFGGYAKSYDNYKPTNYKFEYGVSDPTTGDHKSQWEVKENGVVRGAYSLLEPDGTTRLVEYYADDTGFHADVKKIGTAVHPAPEYGHLHSLSETHITNSLAYNGYGHGGVTHNYGAPIAAPVKIAAAPVEVHAAPIAQVQHIAPIPQVIAPQIHHLGSPQEYGYGHEIPQFYSTPEKVYSAPAPILHHPAPFKVNDEHHYVSAPAPAPVYKEYYSEPQIVKQIHVAQPEIVNYAAHFGPISSPINKEYYPEQVHVAQPEIIKQYYSEPQIVKHVAQPEIKYVQAAAPVPELYAKYIPEPAPVVTKYAAEPAYAPAPEYFPGPVYAAPAAPVQVSKVTKVQAINPIAKFFAPLAKYFTAPPKAVVVPTKVVPTQAVYAEEPVKYVDYDAYQGGYKPEVVYSAPHNYGPQAGYSYSHDY